MLYSHEITFSPLLDVKTEIIYFCEKQFNYQQPRDKYLELLEVTVIKESNRVILNFKILDLYIKLIGCQAIFSLKVFMFRSLLHFIANELQGLRDFNILLQKYIY